MNPKLSICCATYDDAIGVFHTFIALRIHHKLTDEVQLVCVDDKPDGCQQSKQFCATTGVKYVHDPINKGPAKAKNNAIKHSDGDYVWLIDSHVFLQHGAVEYALDLIKQDRIKNNILSGPLLTERNTIYATELVPKWRGEFFGIWETDPQIANGCIQQKEIWGMGSASFLIKKSTWDAIGGFPQHFSGFAGEEGIISEKVRQNGGLHIYHHQLGWYHRFHRFTPLNYQLTLNDKCFNYLIGFYECGWKVSNVLDYFAKKLPPDQLKAVADKALAIYPDLITKTANGKVFEWLD